MTYPTLMLEEQMQNERLARAQTALENGDMAVLPVDPCKWIVVSMGTSPKGKKSQYTVTLDGNAWACTCPDFAGRCQRFGLLCKHIEAIRYLATRQISEAGNINFPNMINALPIQHTEDFMNQTPTMALETAGRACPLPKWAWIHLLLMR
jgi:uncharacterized Zn finger protein